MKTRLILLFLTLLTAQNVFSAHIIGGRFQLTYLQGNSYRIELIIEKDCASGTASFENSCSVGLYNNSTNELEYYYTLTRDSIKNSPYNYSCNGINRCVDVAYYSFITNLFPENLNSFGGYYLQWERCCIADDIMNIVTPGGTPFSALIEIPSLKTQELPITFTLNSSPKFNKIFNPLICINSDFNYQFGFYDSDGDSLAYRFVVPSAGGYTSQFNPGQNTGPKPYDMVVWEFEYNDTNFINTEHGISLNPKTGLLSMKPTQIGKYLFAIAVDEFRNGKKIGTVYYQSIFFVNDCASVILSQPKDQYSIANEPVTFRVKHSDSIINYQWQVLKPNGISESIQNATTDSLVLLTIDSSMNGYKYRCLMTKLGCTDSSSYATLYVNKTGIQKEFYQSIKLYPNPSNSVVYFEDKKERNVKIYAINGKMISERFNCSSFDISELENGLYLIRAESENGFGYAKLIKE